jgi:chromosomal replication initiator protein
MPETPRVAKTHPEISNIWNSALDLLRPKVNPSNFEKWFLPLKCHGIKDNCLILDAPNRYIKEWFEDNFMDSALEALEKTGNPIYRIRIRIREQEFPKPNSERQNTKADLQASSFSSQSSRRSSPTSPPPSQPPSQPPGQTALGGGYTFDSFVVGPSNQLAHAASLAVAEHPARKYNPLFIYGGVGLGKTHLLSAIGNEVRRRRNSWNINYITSERFVVEYINHIRKNRIDHFRKKYRHDCDILLIDDIQFIAGKDRTQEEFFHTFNILYEARRQIVLTSDQFPHEIPGLEDRLRNRFQWGLIADIQSPELETRIAILKKKAESDNISLPDDVAQYLATHIKTNVRELEGALIRLSAYSSLHGRAITIEFAQDSLKSLIERPDIPLSVDRIMDEVCAHFDVKVSDLKGKRRHRSVSYPRQIAMFLARKLTDQSYPEIGAQFGGKDHTTVMAAVKKIKDLEKNDPATRSCLESLYKKIDNH